MSDGEHGTRTNSQKQAGWVMTDAGHNKFLDLALRTDLYATTRLTRVLNDDSNPAILRACNEIHAIYYTGDFQYDIFICRIQAAKSTSYIYVYTPCPSHSLCRRCIGLAPTFDAAVEDLAVKVFCVPDGMECSCEPGGREQIRRQGEVQKICRAQSQKRQAA